MKYVSSFRCADLRFNTADICRCRLPDTFDAMQTNKSDLLRSAAMLIGLESLATGLNVSVPVLQTWIDGPGSMPDRKLLNLADVLEKASRPEPVTLQLDMSVTTEK